MIGEEECVGIFGDQGFALIDRAAKHERVLVFAQPDEQIAADFQRCGAV